MEKDKGYLQMTSIEQYTLKLLEKHGIKRDDATALARARKIIDNTVIPISLKKAYKAAEEYLGIKEGR